MASHSSVHPYVFQSFPPKASVITPRLAKTPAAEMRTAAKPRRWRYSHGAMMRRMPDRGGDAHHPRRPLRAVLSLCAFIGMPPVAVASAIRSIYQSDITLIDVCQAWQSSRADRGNHDPCGSPPP